jgi:hypothetical protein
MSRHPEDPMAKWRDLVGGFILAFGDIDLISYRLWREHVGSHPIPHNFRERTGRVLSALRRTGANHDRVVAALEQALRLSDKRNTVAHHPMQVQVYQHSTTGELLLESVISSETTDDYIDDAELTELSAEAEGLVADLYMALGYIDPRDRDATWVDKSNS